MLSCKTYRHLIAIALLGLLTSCAIPSGTLVAQGENGKVGEGIMVDKGSAGNDSAQAVGLGVKTDFSSQTAQKDLLSRNTIYFSFDNNRLLNQGLLPLKRNHREKELATVTPQLVLKAYSYYLMKHPHAKLRLEGHTDARGSREYNIALGERRAKAIAQFMRSQGVAQAQLAVISYGKEKPVAEGHNEDAYSQNRRVNLLFEAS